MRNCVSAGSAFVMLATLALRLLGKQTSRVPATSDQSDALCHTMWRISRPPSSWCDHRTVRTASIWHVMATVSLTVSYRFLSVLELFWIIIVIYCTI